MRFLVLGSGAGGGLPQWNCLCENCRLAFERDGRIVQRSQASVAVSADGDNWVVLSASPDLRQQIIANPELHPKAAPRHSPIKGVFAPNGDVDNIAGLLVMREMQPFTLWATKSVMANTLGGVFGVLNPDVVKRETVEIEQAIDTGFGFTLTPFVAPGKIPLYLESRNESEIELGAESDTTVGVEIRQGDRRFYYMPSCARMTDALRKRLDGAEIVFFDGTTFEDDEMIRLGLLNKTAWRMGHMAMNGEKGTIASLADLAIGRRIFVHINNSNPALRHDSPERAQAESSGWEIGFDGMRIDLSETRP
ncbi:pyrroloquinoline quinone biosynthesis protein PqqB [Rhodoblastus acidophilus]|uniref:Coenzyme PQQ synthesis protein B n=1 Tax=Candidatus Rhodoblastus alkanivorans TaxID=2954117 RepID=A0ABS9Z4T9_9HYPH|nr:pyrroloquinoline quinone biosynthesis protein PqqB [Candidatus Rhodoblastus alkanivorans]MCI4682694.1 pyrroloquinoline quinone biosynthesis protein PqqB [Candidatus Rhodoblastus alkanivorans]MDI4640001.1 pyrroloquinoline quinone biosynthesis protein PqqB [Rhodoblastus acidophilus]